MFTKILAGALIAVATIGTGVYFASAPQHCCGSRDVAVNATAEPCSEESCCQSKSACCDATESSFESTKPCCETGCGACCAPGALCCEKPCCKK